MVAGEEVLVKFIEGLRTAPDSDDEANMMRLDFSNKWFTLMHSTRPFTIRDFQELADHVCHFIVIVHSVSQIFLLLRLPSGMQAAAALETVRDITVASNLIGDTTDATLDDPLSDRYKKLGCSVTPLEKESEDYKMIVKYLETTYEPVKLGDVVRNFLVRTISVDCVHYCTNLVSYMQSYGVSVENIFAVKTNAGPSYDDIKKLPNKILLWCGKFPQLFTGLLCSASLA